MIRAKIDPGSAVVAVGIFADDAAPPFATRCLDARPFDVGLVTKHDPPLTGFYADKKRKDGTVIPGGPWTRKETREVTEAHEQEVAARVVAYLLGHGVEEVTLERIGHAFGDTIGEVASRSKFLIITARIASSISARCKLLGIAVAPGPLAVTWRARLAPLVREHGGDVAGPAIRGEGSALDPVLLALIEGWKPTTVDHIRVCGGLALWSALPPLPGRERKASGPRGTRGGDGVKRIAKGGKAGRYPKGARDRAKMSEAERERSRGVDRARYARGRPTTPTACDCKPTLESKRGRHKRTCPMHRPCGA